MGSDCLQRQPLEPYHIYLGFIAFAIFFAILLRCQSSGAKRVKNNQKNIRNLQHKELRSKFYKQESQYFSKVPQFSENSTLKLPVSQTKEENKQQSYKKSRIIETGPQIFSKTNSMQKVLKNFTEYSYNYVKNQHKMLKIFRPQQQIKKQRALYLGIQQPEQPIKKLQSPQKKVQISNEPKKQSTIKRSQSFLKPQDRIMKKQQIDSKNNKKQKEQVNKIDVSTSNEMKGIKPSIFNNPQNKNPSTSFGTLIGSGITNPLIFDNTENIQTFKQNFYLQNNLAQQKNIQKKQQKPVISTTKPKAKQQQNKQKKKTENIQQQLVSTDKIKQKQLQKPTEAKVTTQINKQQVNQMKKLTNSIQYLDAIVKYSDKFVAKKQITTKIGNLDGARSDPITLWQFTSTYITTIDTKNNDELVTFTYKIWQAIVHKFMKNTNIKDGFQKIPPKQRNKQVYKNQINTYVLFVTIYRALGFEEIWLGVFGKTLKMLNFLFKRKQVIKNWKKLDLIQNQYISFDGNMSQKYLTRIDFLTYFLLALTTFDPIQAFQQISEKTGENYSFLNDLKKAKNKWSYRQFWCLVQTMRKNNFEGYFKIPFWNNALSVIYLPMLKFLKLNQMKQFTILSKWIFKECKELTKKIDKAQQSKILQDQVFQDKQYQFDGEQFINSIKSLGKGMETRQRQMRLNKWEDFRDRCSILYFFWRISS